MAKYRALFHIISLSQNKLQETEAVGILYEKHFGEQAYFGNPIEVYQQRWEVIWLCYAANLVLLGWRKIHVHSAGSRYGMCLQVSQTLETSDKKNNSALNSKIMWI
jgi:hypothetical protein